MWNNLYDNCCKYLDDKSGCGCERQDLVMTAGRGYMRDRILAIEQ